MLIKSSWLNSGLELAILALHAQPEDGPAVYELMRAVLPITEANEVMEIAAYNPHQHTEWLQNREYPAGYDDIDLPDKQEVIETPSFSIPCHKDGYFFLQRIVHAKHGVPRMQAGGNGLSP